MPAVTCGVGCGGVGWGGGEGGGGGGLGACLPCTCGEWRARVKAAVACACGGRVAAAAVHMVAGLLGRPRTMTESQALSVTAKMAQLTPPKLAVHCNVGALALNDMLGSVEHLVYGEPWLWPTIVAAYSD
jgi:hypothetical protein